MKFFKQKQQPSTRQPNLMEGQDSYTFRRSRTLTGSAASQVKSAAEDRSNIKSPRLKAHELRRHQKAIVISLVITLAASLFLGWLVGQYISVPKQISMSAELSPQPQEAPYLQTLESYFIEHPTEKFLFHMNADTLNAYMNERHNEVKSVTLDMKAPGVFMVDVAFRKPLLSWKSGDVSVYVDDEGAAFTKNYYAEPSVIVEDKSGIQLENNVVASNRFIAFLGRLVSNINESGAGLVANVVIPADAARQVDIILDGKGYPIKTHIDRDPFAQAQDVGNAVKYMDQKGIQPQYTDVRVAGKAYYR